MPCSLSNVCKTNTVAKPYCLSPTPAPDRKSTRLNSSHTVIYTLSLHDALPIFPGFFPELKFHAVLLVQRLQDQHCCKALLPFSDSSARSEERRVGKKCKSR